MSIFYDSPYVTRVLLRLDRIPLRPERHRNGGFALVTVSYFCQFIGFLPFVVLFVIFPFRKVCHLTKIWNCPNPLRCAEPLERGASPTAPSPGALSPLRCSYVLSVFGFLPFVVSYFFITPKGRMLIRHSEKRLLTGP